MLPKYSILKKSPLLLLLLTVTLGIASCNTAKTNGQKTEQSRVAEFKPLRDPKLELPIDGASKPSPQPQNATQFIAGPGVNITRQIADAQSKEVSVNLTGPAVTANYHDMPLPVFINQVFGEQLGLSFTLDPQIEKQSDLVTLRINEAVSPNELFHVALRTLAAYGVAVSQQDKLLTFSIDKNASAGETPLLVSGRALPDVPESHRPVFMFVQLKTVSNAKVAGWVRDALTGKEIQIQEDPSRNAVLLKGKPDVVAQAVSIIEVLDQPIMRGKYSTSIEPAFSKAKDLSQNLKEVLNAEGYDASIKSSIGSIIIVPLEGANQLVVFASSQAILEHVRDWVRQLDRRQQLSIDQGIFTYEVKNTDADHIVEMLGGLGGAGGGKSNASSLRKSEASPSGTALSDKTSASGVAPSVSGQLGDGSFVVDTNRNTIIYKGSGQSWADLLPVIQSLDKSAPSVLVEVLIAEVSLTDKENSGFEFLDYVNGTIGDKKYMGTFQTLKGLGLGTGGLTGTINSAGTTRAMLNIFQQNKRAEIRSRPRLMVKSGQEATIDVGQQVPTRGSISTSGSVTTSGGSLQSNLVQNIGSVKTGVRLAVKPIVHASGNVDIEIEQELSEATKTDSSSIDSPTVFNRKVKTMVSLKDGGSILIGGLISSSKSKTNTGVPKLASVPLLGRFFSTDADASDRTELMIMIIPYVLDTPEDGQAITKTLQDAFQSVE